MDNGNGIEQKRNELTELGGHSTSKWALKLY